MNKTLLDTKSPITVLSDEDTRVLIIDQFIHTLNIERERENNRRYLLEFEKNNLLTIEKFRLENSSYTPPIKSEDMPIAFLGSTTPELATLYKLCTNSPSGFTRKFWTFLSKQHETINL